MYARYSRGAQRQVQAAGWEDWQESLDYRDGETRYSRGAQRQVQAAGWEDQQESLVMGRRGTFKSRNVRGKGGFKIAMLNNYFDSPNKPAL